MIKITIMIEDKEYSVNEAKKLYEELHKIFGEKQSLIFPDYPIYPIYPGTPVDPYYPMHPWTTSGVVTVDETNEIWFNSSGSAIWPYKSEGSNENKE